MKNKLFLSFMLWASGSLLAADHTNDGSNFDKQIKELAAAFGSDRESVDEEEMDGEESERDARGALFNNQIFILSKEVGMPSDEKEKAIRGCIMECAFPVEQVEKLVRALTDEAMLSMTDQEREFYALVKKAHVDYLADCKASKL
jgi:hypothetical protein